MSYEDVKAKCLFCNAQVEGNQRFMIRGLNLPGRRGACPLWLKGKPEHQWMWNGLNRQGLNQDFYLCPEHTARVFIDCAFKWTKSQLRNGNVIDFTNPLALLVEPLALKEIKKEAK